MLGKCVYVLAVPEYGWTQLVGLSLLRFRRLGFRVLRYCWSRRPRWCQMVLGLLELWYGLLVRRWGPNYLE